MHPTKITAIYKYIWYKGSCSGDDSFKGDCNDEEEYGDQNQLFDVIASTVGRTSDRPELYDNISQCDLLPEDFLRNAFLKVSGAQKVFVIYKNTRIV